jgi:hypothetical protein
MDSTLLAAIIGAIVFIAIAVAGWAVRRAREQRERAGVRLRLRVECAQNISALTEFWRQVDSSQYFQYQTGYSPEEIAFHKRRRLASVPLPAWSHLMWERQAEAARLDLNQEELEHAPRLHTDLDTFSEMRGKLQEALATDANSRLSRDFDDWMQEKARGRAPRTSMPSPPRTPPRPKRPPKPNVPRETARMPPSMPNMPSSRPTMPRTPTVSLWMKTPPNVLAPLARRERRGPPLGACRG